MSDALPANTRHAPQSTKAHDAGDEPLRTALQEIAARHLRAFWRLTDDKADMDTKPFDGIL